MSVNINSLFQTFFERKEIDFNHSFSLEEFQKLLEENKERVFELNPEGKITEKMPSSKIEDEINAFLLGELHGWNKQTNPWRGRVYGSQALWNLGNGYHVAPDVAFLPRNLYLNMTVQQQTTYQGPPLAPTFVVETKPCINNFDAADLKMRNAYRAAGVPLAWLIVIEEQSLYIYRPNHNRVKFNWDRIVGDSNTGILPGFQFDLRILHNIVAGTV